MSTHCLIAAATPGGFLSVTCQNNGSPRGPHGVGFDLLNHYGDPGKVEALIRLGQLSSVGPEIGEKHEFDQAVTHTHQCRAYGRDRGEPGVGPVMHPRFEDMVEYARESCAEHLYLWLDELWLYAPVPCGGAALTFADVWVLRPADTERKVPEMVDGTTYLPLAEPGEYKTHLMVSVDYDKGKGICLGVTPVGVGDHSIALPVCGGKRTWLELPMKRLNRKKLEAVRDEVADSLRRQTGTAWCLVREVLRDEKLCLAD